MRSKLGVRAEAGYGNEVEWAEERVGIPVDRKVQIWYDSMIRYNRSCGKLISIVNSHVPRIGFQKWKREADLPLWGTRPLNIINRGTQK